MVSTKIHGGGCCGRRHIYGFDRPGNFQEHHDAIQRRHGDRTNLVTEIVLTDDQMRRNRARIEAAGYRRVARWRNSNSGNFCNMFLHGRDVAYGAADLFVGCRVRVKRSGAEGVVERSADGGRARVILDAGPVRTYARSSLVNIAEKI